MLSESLHPNRPVAGSFAFSSRNWLQVGFHLCQLSNIVIADKADGIGFSQRNGWFGRHYRQTVKLSDFVSHPQIGVESAVCDVPVNLNFRVPVAAPDNPASPLYKVSRSFFADSSIHACLLRSLLLRFVSVP